MPALSVNIRVASSKRALSIDKETLHLAIMDESKPFLDNPESDMAEREVKLPFLNNTKRRILCSNVATFIVTSFLWALIAFSSIWRRDCSIDSSAYDGSTATSQAQPGLDFFSTHRGYLSCGHSKEEAKASGCEYDILTNHWLPGQCKDAKSIADYQSDGSWMPYADLARTEQLSVAELGEREFYYTSLRDHIVHCAMLWRRQYRAFSEGWKFVDSITADGNHTDHCSGFLMDMADLERFRAEPIVVSVGRSGCYVQED